MIARGSVDGQGAGAFVQVGGRCAGGTPNDWRAGSNPTQAGFGICNVFRMTLL
jgi:hypothetical protein